MESQRDSAELAVIRVCENLSDDAEEMYVLVTGTWSNISFVLTNGVSCWKGDLSNPEFTELFEAHVTRNESKDEFRAILTGVDKNFRIAAESVEGQKELSWWEGDFGLGFTKLLTPVADPLQQIKACIALMSRHVAQLWNAHVALRLAQRQLQEDIHAVAKQEETIRKRFESEHSHMLDEMARALNFEKHKIALLKSVIKKSSSLSTGASSVKSTQSLDCNAGTKTDIVDSAAAAADVDMDADNAYDVDTDDSSDAGSDTGLDPTADADLTSVSDVARELQRGLPKKQEGSTVESLSSKKLSTDGDDDAEEDWEM
eukprot:m.29058 g.29058  ORF g.29058 m.29058 type:complete len:315 (-) comp13668_c0_seq4:344-1288(-)